MDQSFVARAAPLSSLRELGGRIPVRRIEDLASLDDGFEVLIDAAPLETVTVCGRVGIRYLLEGAGKPHTRTLTVWVDSDDRPLASLVDRCRTFRGPLPATILEEVLCTSATDLDGLFA